MNDNLDLTKILEGCPKGTKFYSTLFGEVEFVGISDGRIIVNCVRINRRSMFNVAGKYEMSELRYSDDWGNHLHSDECLLFPSKDQRNWSKFERFWDKPKKEKFDVNTLQPFDKVLMRTNERNIWEPDFFGYKDGNWIMGVTVGNVECIPYNEETKHLIGTKEDCPEFYKWWEE